MRDDAVSSPELAGYTAMDPSLHHYAKWSLTLENVYFFL